MRHPLEYRRTADRSGEFDRGRPEHEHAVSTGFSGYRLEFRSAQLRAACNHRADRYFEFALNLPEGAGDRIMNQILVARGDAQ